jgi:succinate dehydrogenase/fumarate reductase flavoprotein subunit
VHHFPNRLIGGTTHQSVMFNSDREMFMRNEDFDVSMPYTVQMKNIYREVKRGKARWDGGYFTDYPEVEPGILERLYYHTQFYDRLEQDGSNKPINLASYDAMVAGTHAARRSRARAMPQLDGTQVRSGEERIASYLATARQPGVSPMQVKMQIRAIVWDKLMFVKTASGLNEALASLKAIENEVVPRMRLRTDTTRFNTDMIDALDVRDMLEVVEMVIQAALARQESRGPHFREDFPFTDNKSWLKYVVVRRDNASVKTRLEPVNQKFVRPKREIVDYFANPFA